MVLAVDTTAFAETAGAATAAAAAVFAPVLLALALLLLPLLLPPPPLLLLLLLLLPLSMLTLMVGRGSGARPIAVSPAADNTAMAKWHLNCAVLVYEVTHEVLSVSTQGY